MAEVTALPKEEARRYVVERLSNLSETTIEQWSSTIFDRTLQLLIRIQKQSTLSHLLLYQPISKWHEVDLTKLTSFFPNCTIDFVQPSKHATPPTKIYDCIIMPLLGFDSQNIRLGHGGGWYDTLLQNQPDALKIGIGYELNSIHFITESHDAAMDVVITEQTLHCSKTIVWLEPLV